MEFFVILGVTKKAFTVSVFCILIIKIIKCIYLAKHIQVIMQKCELFRKQMALFMSFTVAEDLFKVRLIAIIF